MSHLIDSVATLIDVRDKDDLEITLARVMFELVNATALRLWRVTNRKDGIVLRERVRLEATVTLARAPVADGAEIDLRNASAELRAAHDTKLQRRLSFGADAATRHVFPILDESQVLCLLEIDLASPMSFEQEQLVSGLLRIYRSHFGVLDFGDTDELTGLANRRPFDEAFRRVAASASSLSRETPPPYPRNLGADTGPRAHLAVADIDFFKRINDRFGHPYGDEVLVLLSRLMSECFQDRSRLFRFGGEEFLIILANADASEADAALERFRVAVETFGFPQVGHVTISMGVTSIRVGDTGSNAFGRADAALYAAKHGGRNQLRRFERLVADGHLAENAPAAMDVEMF